MFLTRKLKVTLDEITKAVLDGKQVCWTNSAYKVVVDCHKQWFIVCDNGSTIGLTNRNGHSLNGEEKDFFIYEAPVSAQEMIDLYTESSKNKREQLLSKIYGQIKANAKYRTNVEFNKIKFKLDFLSQEELEKLGYKITPAKDGNMNYTISWKPKSQKEIIAQMLEA